MTIGYKFRILNANGSVSSTTVDMDDMFVPRDAFLNSGLYGWGLNNQGQIGDNSARVHRSSPVQVGSLTNWKLVSAGLYHILAIKTDGTLWAWGNGSTGELGLNDTTAKSSPTQVGSLTDWKQVDCSGLWNTFAIKYDGTLWSWGYNNTGELGLNDIVYRSSPTQVGSLTNWKQVATAKAGQVSVNHMAAVKTDGTLWVWGRNFDGGLGLSDLVHRSSPVQVGSLTNWKFVACGSYSTFAVKTDGTLWAWGRNTEGALGLNDRTSRSSPVQVGTLTNWKQVAATDHTVAIKIDGTLWGWGRNGIGQIGLNDLAHRSSPVQVGSLANWKVVTCGRSHTVAIKTDGTLWATGNNIIGQLGDNSARVHRSSPVQIGSSANWKQVSAHNQTLAIVSDDFYTYNNP